MPEAVEPYFQLVSAAIIIGIALWMMWRTGAISSERGTRREATDTRTVTGMTTRTVTTGTRMRPDTRRIDTGHGVVALEVFEDGVPPRWRLHVERGRAWAAGDVAVVTERPDGARQTFSFADRGGYFESVEEIPEPHGFMARLSLGHAGHSHDYDLSFVEGHGHDHMHEELRGLQVATDGYQDAHELAHANDIRRRSRAATSRPGRSCCSG